MFQFLDNRFKDIEIFLPKSNILNYTKNNLVKLFKDIRELNKKSIFVSHSSSLELQLLYLISNCKFFLALMVVMIIFSLIKLIKTKLRINTKFIMNYFLIT